METIQTILPNQVHQALLSNQISELKLKDGTILKITPKLNLLNKKNIILPGKGSRSTLIKSQYFQQNCNHHKDGLGAFGQHFKTEYIQICPDCTEVGGIIKRRKNYVLYVSKNITEENISKNKNKNYSQNKVHIREKIPIYRNYIKKNYNQQNEGKILWQGTIECNEEPIIEPKIKLKNEQNKYKKDVCPECTEVQKLQAFNQGNQYQLKESLCPDCFNEEQEEKITTTVKVLVPDENA